MNLHTAPDATVGTNYWWEWDNSQWHVVTVNFHDDGRAFSDPHGDLLCNGIYAPCLPPESPIRHPREQFPSVKISDILDSGATQ